MKASVAVGTPLVAGLLLATTAYAGVVASERAGGDRPQLRTPASFEVQVQQTRADLP